MTGAPQTNGLTDLCAALLAEEEGRLLVIGGGDGVPDTAFDSLTVPVVRAEDPDATGQLGEIAGPERFSLSLIFPGPGAGGDAAGLSRLLASLRDRYARRVLVSDDAGILSLNDYLALGFERLEAPRLKSVYLFDPDAESRQRDWNNARNWANPENFDRFRW